MAVRRSKSGDSAFKAIEQANFLACSPFVFQAAYCLREFGILEFLEKSKAGATLNEIQDGIPQKLTIYALRVLTELGTAFGLLRKSEERYFVTKESLFLLHDAMTRANFDFAHDVCYAGLDFLKDALLEGRPSGLKTLYPGMKTIYPVISKLPEPAHTSWFEFDHYYSDVSYDAALPYLFERKPKKICDVGGNTGKFSIKCCTYNSDVHVTIFDLPEQCAIAKENAKKAGFESRIDTHPVDLLENKPFEKSDADIWWMSQFLDCFGEHDVISILTRIASAMSDTARIAVLEPLIGKQPFAVGDACLTAFSLYFTALANGTSKFYSLEDFERFTKAAGLVIENEYDGLGTGHTLLILKRAN